MRISSFLIWYRISENPYVVRESQAELEHHTNSVRNRFGKKKLAKVKQPELPKPSPAPVVPAHESDEESLGVF